MTCENWLEFRETFKSLIHCNDSLDETQKYHYLRFSLLDNAAEVIASLEFSPENYTSAWNLLNERYNNTITILVQNHVKALFNMEISRKETARLLRYVVDSLAKHLKALKQLKQPVEYWDTLIIYIATSKLDSATSRDWERYIADKASPSLDNLKLFLKNKADMLETLELKRTDNRSYKDSKHINSKSFAANTNLIRDNYNSQVYDQASREKSK